MKSPMVETLPYLKQEAQYYSELKVMKSGAGYYVGTTFNNEGYDEPGSRDSGYFATREDAAEALELIEKGILKTRMNP